MQNQILKKRILAFLIDLVISSIVGVGLSMFIYSYVIPFIIFGAYYIIMDLSPLQGTVGNYIMKLKVVDIQSNKISLTQSLSRHIGRLISIFTLNFVNKFKPFKTEMFHDTFSNTKLVISK